MTTNSPKTKTLPDTIPPLTPETVERAKEGLEAACDRAVKGGIEQALGEISQIGEGGEDRRASGALRRFVMRSLIHLLFRVKVEYPERLPCGAAIIAPNHLNHIDPFLLLSELPSAPFYYILGDARTLYNQWWKRRILRFAGGVIPLVRRWREEFAVIEGAKTDAPELTELAKAIEENVPTGGDIQTLRQIDRSVQGILARGDGIILFPEGRLGTAEGQLILPLKKGVALYALRSGVPIVPVAIIGTKNLFLWKTLTLRIGYPLEIPQVKHPKRKEIEEVLDKLEKALIELMPENYQETAQLKLFSHFLNRIFY
ncbi:phospholipid/glycerol acyltransferase [Gloeothece citriformis PCC 7424]|uniref:Phospholipid/glycerol acyltransferase n=1 Tax=Gloeothece citriformis (strain PCC 7424) TaxID=65393 RepID=B7K755_GLOC7|nr:1-acyl-sn-glycerol-3-phosphate acyltransferase [Gloeothece citriformis]ACK69623.1 phospholipid/glycerol acyltransferase [Gloeothece citriformis PCC 7424]